MNKIFVLTTSYATNGLFGCNYGASLQGYALIHKLRELGYDAYDINYISSNAYVPQQVSRSRRFLIRTRLLFSPKAVKSKIKSLKNKKNLEMLKGKFLKFINDYRLTFQNGQFYNIQKLSELSKDAFAFIVGSDVVWNPLLYENKVDEGFYLDFVEKPCRKIAYAPSIGINELPDECKKDFKEKILKFDFVSIREKTGAQIVKQETGLDVPVVLDPTLLLKADEYETIIKVPNSLPEHYIAVYKFGNLEYVNEKIEEIKKKYNLPLIYIPSDLNNPKSRYDLGPGEFIGVIKNADLVISDSFHCSIFCLLMHTPFVTFYRTMPQPGRDINSRMVDLLKMVDLEELMITPGKKINYEYLKHIDFDKTDSLIEKRRKESLIYLNNALKE